MESSRAAESKSLWTRIPDNPKNSQAIDAYGNVSPLVTRQAVGLCPDEDFALEPHLGELEVQQKAYTTGRTIGCLPAWLGPVACADQVHHSCGQGSCDPCTSSVPKKDQPLHVHIEILGLVVTGDGLTVIPVPRESAVLDPRSWFAWRPLVEVIAPGVSIYSSEGKRTMSPAFSAGQAQEGCWDGLNLGDLGGGADIVIDAGETLRFRVMRARSFALFKDGSRQVEEAFTANISMDHDFVSKGYPERLVRPIFYRHASGDIRHVGHLHINLRLGKSSGKMDKKDASKEVRVPTDYHTVQGALDSVLVLPGKSSESTHVVLCGDTHPGDVYVRKSLVLTGVEGKRPIIQGNVFIEVGGEDAVVQNIEVHGFIAIRVGRPHIFGCIVEATLPGKDLGDNSALTISGSGSRPWIETNTIRHGCGPGVVFRNGSGGTLRNNAVQGNKGSGVEVRDFGTSPVVEGNHISENSQNGILVHSGAAGTFQDNDVHRNTLCGIRLTADTGSGLVVQRNRVHENQQGGIISEGKHSLGSNQIVENEELGPPRGVAPPLDVYGHGYDHNQVPAYGQVYDHNQEPAYGHGYDHNHVPGYDHGYDHGNDQAYDPVFNDPVFR